MDGSATDGRSKGNCAARGSEPDRRNMDGGEQNSVSWKPPLIFHSKILCLSLLYLLTTVSLAIYASFSATSFPCVFSVQPPRTAARYLPPPRPPLFAYPPGYGERKHAFPASASASTCNSPLLFPEYRVAYDEIQALCANSSSSSPVLRYMAPKSGGDGGNTSSTFAGNFSTQKRKSFFDHPQGNHDVEIPCGFLTEFPLHPSDRIAMEACRGVVVASAIFGDYDKIRQPKGVGERTLAAVCFFMFIDEATLKGLHSHGIFLDNQTMGVWRTVVVGAGPLPYQGGGAMNGVIPKHLIHRLFPNTRYSIWVDAKLQLVVDPLLLLHSLLVSKDADMAVSKHPLNVHTMEEAVATARWRKWRDVDALRLQMETYCANGLRPWSSDKLPYTTDVPDTALIARRHGLRSDLFSCLLFNELDAFNPRDQLAFAYVRDLMSPKIRIQMFDAETLQQISVEYRHNLMKPSGGEKGTAAATAWRRASSRDVKGSSCERYLSKMWGQTED